MRIQSFEDVIAWQKGKQLYTEPAEEFKNNKDLTDTTLDIPKLLTGFIKRLMTDDKRRETRS